MEVNLDTLALEWEEQVRERADAASALGIDPDALDEVDGALERLVEHADGGRLADDRRCRARLCERLLRLAQRLRVVRIQGQGGRQRPRRLLQTRLAQALLEVNDEARMLAVGRLPLAGQRSRELWSQRQRGAIGRLVVAGGDEASSPRSIRSSSRPTAARSSSGSAGTRAVDVQSHVTHLQGNTLEDRRADRRRPSRRELSGSMAIAARTRPRCRGQTARRPPGRRSRGRTARRGSRVEVGAARVDEERRRTGPSADRHPPDLRRRIAGARGRVGFLTQRHVLDVGQQAFRQHRLHARQRLVGVGPRHPEAERAAGARGGGHRAGRHLRRELLRRAAWRAGTSPDGVVAGDAGDLPSPGGHDCARRLHPHRCWPASAPRAGRS